jgi:hypothetical protein
MIDAWIIIIVVAMTMIDAWIIIVVVAMNNDRCMDHHRRRRDRIARCHSAIALRVGMPAPGRGMVDR